MDIDALRNWIVNQLPGLGCDAVEPNWETSLAVDGQYLGRRFEFDTLRAIWNRSRNVVEFYDGEWRMLKELPLTFGEQATTSQAEENGDAATRETA